MNKVKRNSKKRIQHALQLVKESIKNGGKIVFQSDRWIILTVNSYESAAVFKENNDWSILGDAGYYLNYSFHFGGDFFINIDLESGKLYLLHFESNTFLDIYDCDSRYNCDEMKDIKKIAGDIKEFYKSYVLNHKKVIERPSNWIWLDPECITEVMKWEALKENPLNMEYIEDSSEEMQLAAVKEYGRAIEYIKNPSEEVQLAAVESYGRAIQYIKNPSRDVQLVAVKKNGTVIECIENPSDEIQYEAVEAHPSAIIYIKDPSEKLQLEAIKQQSNLINYIKNPTEIVKSIWEKLYG